MGLIYLIKHAVLLNKVRKIDTNEKYIEYLKKDKQDFRPLSIGNIDNLKETSYENLFQYISEYDKLKEKYRLNEIAVGENDFEKALLVMNWLTDNTMYSGVQLHCLPDDTMQILDFSFGKSFKFAINCRDKAIALTDLLLSVGIKAYPVLLTDDKQWGCHLVTHIYCKELKKWVLFDPSFNTYFTDENGKVLDVFELRDLFLADKKPNLNGYVFNGTDECNDIYLNMFIKQCLTNISTWHDNSMDYRTEPRKWSKKKAFDYKLPPLEVIQQADKNN